MKTFREFVAERYYEPDEPLPSGKTPYGKATSSYYRQKGEFKRSPVRTSDQAFRVTRQGSRRSNEVSRGANNPDFDARPDKSGRYDVQTDSSYRMSVRDTKNDLEMRIRQKDQIAPGNKPVYDVEWYNNSGKRNNNPGEARRVVRNVADMWKNQVAPRIPSNSVLTNFPIMNNTSERNTRSKLYSKVAGFGRPGSLGRQYANVGRNPSSKQAAKGAQRITPLSGNLDPEWVTNRELGRMDAARMHLPRGARVRITKDLAKEFGPRKIAPAKPSRPSQTKAVNALKSTAPMKSPAIPKPAAPKPVAKPVAKPALPKPVAKPTIKPAVKSTLVPKVLSSIKPPKIRGGRAGLAAAGIVGIGALAGALMNKSKK